MSGLPAVAEAFVAMAHRIVWASVATVDAHGRPRSRILHPIWQWDGSSLVGWVGTGPTPVKVGDLDANPYASLSYWAPDQDTCSAECHARIDRDPAVRTWLWELLERTPPPLGYDPAIIPQWNEPTDDSFAALRLDPYRLRVMPGTLMTQGVGELLTWRGEAATVPS